MQLDVPVADSILQRLARVCEVDLVVVPKLREPRAEYVHYLPLTYFERPSGVLRDMIAKQIGRAGMCTIVQHAQYRAMSEMRTL
jgi:hypothetical protein